MSFRGRKRWKTDFSDSIFSVEKSGKFNKILFTGVAKVGIGLLKSANKVDKKKNTVDSNLPFFNMWRSHFIKGYESNNKQILNYLIKQKPKTYYKFIKNSFLNGEFISLEQYLSIKSNDSESFTKIYNALINIEPSTAYINTSSTHQEDNPLLILIIIVFIFFIIYAIS